MGERLELVVAGSDDLFTLFPAVAEECCIVANQNNRGNAVAELRQNLLDDPGVGLVEADVNCRKRFITRREVACRSELALRVWVRQLHGVLMRRQNAISISQILKPIESSRDIAGENTWKRNRPEALGLHAFAAFSNAAMSILSISIIASMTRFAFPASRSANISPRKTGLTCHETPNLSLSQPHLPVDPPSAESFSQK